MCEGVFAWRKGGGTDRRGEHGQSTYYICGSVYKGSGIHHQDRTRTIIGDLMKGQCYEHFYEKLHRHLYISIFNTAGTVY